MKTRHEYPTSRWGGLIALTLSVSLCSLPAALAEVLAYESFSYPEGAEIEGGADGSGWAAPWIQQATNNGSETITAGSLATGYPGFDASSQGNSATLNAGHRVARLLDVSPEGPFGVNGYLDANGNIGADGTTLYLSFVIAETGGNENGYFEFVFNRDSLGDSGRIGGIGDDRAGANFHLRTGSTHTQLIRRDTNVHRFVVRFDFLAGNDRVTVYADPASATEPAGGDVQVTLANMAFDGLSFAAFNGGNILHVDEIRIATTYAEAAIAGAPEWIAGTGPFGNATNWSTYQVPHGIDAGILNGGTAEIADGDAFFVDTLSLGGYDGSGTLSLSGGTLDLSKLNVGGTNVLGGSGAGILHMSGGGVYGTGGEEMWFGSRGGTGTLYMSGSAILSNNQQIHFGRDGSSSQATIGGHAALSATQMGVGVASPGKTSEIIVENEATFRATAGNLAVGWFGDATNEGIFRIRDSASVSVNGEMWIGANGGSGELEMTGGTLQVTGSRGYLASGRDGGSGSIAISGNSTVEVSRSLMAGAYINGSGSITVSDEAVVTAERFTVAYEHNTSGIFTVNGGELLATAPGGTGVVLGGGGTGTTRRLDLNGGIVTASGFAKKDGDLPLDIHFNGGTVRAAEDNSDYFRSGAADGSPLGIVATDLELQDGGLKFDTAGFEVGITQALSGNGGVTKSGEGSLTISGESSYRGDTTVLGGSLQLDHPSLNDHSTVSISGEDTTLALAYEGTDTVAYLMVDGVEQLPGLYRSAEGSGPGTVLSQLTGTGVLNVSGQVFDYAAWLAANGPATGFETDSDDDGIPNGVEHVLGSDPNLPTPGLVSTPSGGGSVVVTHRLNPQIASDVTFHYEWSTDLIEWKRSGETNAAGVSVGIVAGAPVDDQVTVTATPAAGAPGTLFIRLVTELDS